MNKATALHNAGLTRSQDRVRPVKVSEDEAQVSYKFAEKPKGERPLDSVVKPVPIDPKAGRREPPKWMKDEKPKTPKYDPIAVNKEIAKDPSIKGKEAKLIHSVLKGWRGDDSAFKKLEEKLESEGKSKEQAGGIAYKVGAEKYGKAGMAKKAAEGRRAKDAKHHSYTRDPNSKSNKCVICGGNKTAAAHYQSAKDSLRPVPLGQVVTKRDLEVDRYFRSLVKSERYTIPGIKALLRQKFPEEAPDFIKNTPYFNLMAEDSVVKPVA